MRTTLYLTHPREFSAILAAEVSEVIIGIKEFSRRGTLDLRDGLELAKRTREYKLRVILEWDALMEEPRLKKLTALLATLDFKFDAIRVRDAGAVLWVRNNTTQPIHLLLEAGHHNIMALKSWSERLGTRLERIILSPELPAKTIKAWRSELNIEIEVLGLGPLLLFHSPRALLSSLASAPEQEEWIAEGASEESPHKGFPLFENQHGTLMFHPKDLSILERTTEIKESGVDWLRIDHRHETDPKALERVCQFLVKPSEENLLAIQNTWSRAWMRGYWDVNKSDVLFDKLTNQHLSERATACAEVLEGKKEAWLAVRVIGKGLKLGSEIDVTSPLGKVRRLKLAWLKDDAFEAVNELSAGQVGFVPWSSGAPAKSQLHLID
jgi:putative protease